MKAGGRRVNIVSLGNKKQGLMGLLCLGVVATLTMTVSAQPPIPLNDVVVEVSPIHQTGTPGDVLTYNINLMNAGTIPDIIVFDSITGVPTGWTVELKDAGVPQILPFQTPLLQSKE